MDNQDWQDYEDYCERCLRQGITPNSYPFWDKTTRGTKPVNYEGKQPAQTPVASADADNGMTAHELYTQADARAAALEAENAKLREILEDARDQIIVHMGTLGILAAWFRKQPGFLPEDGFTEDAMLTMVEYDLEASYDPAYESKADRKGGA